MVITYGVRDKFDKLKQGMLFSSDCVYRNKMFLMLYPLIKPFTILYIVCMRI